MCDDRLGGWYAVHAVVAGVTPGEITLQEPLSTCHEEGVFRPERQARLANDFPMIRGNRFHTDPPLEDVSVTDLVLDGSPEGSRFGRQRLHDRGRPSGERPRRLGARRHRPAVRWATGSACKGGRRPRARLPGRTMPYAPGTIPAPRCGSPVFANDVGRPRRRRAVLLRRPRDHRDRKPVSRKRRQRHRRSGRSARRRPIQRRLRQRSAGATGVTAFSPTAAV